MKNIDIKVSNTQVSFTPKSRSSKWGTKNHNDVRTHLQLYCLSIPKQDIISSQDNPYLPGLSRTNITSSATNQTYSSMLFTKLQHQSNTICTPYIFLQVLTYLILLILVSIVLITASRVKHVSNMRSSTSWRVTFSTSRPPDSSSLSSTVQAFISNDHMVQDCGLFSLKNPIANFSN